MVCQACGNPVETEVRYCSKCGAQVAGPEMPGQQFSGAGVTGTAAAYMTSTAPPMYAAHPPMIPFYVPRVERHVQILGVLWCVYGAYRVIGGLVGMIFLRAWSMHTFGNGGWPMRGAFGDFGPAWLNAMLPFVAVMTVVAAFLSFAVGISLLTRRPWGRVLGIVVAILALLKFPLGTALGIYTLWVLAPSASRMEYDAIADPS